MGLKIEVDFDKCESNAVCMAVAPAYFEVRDDDFLYVLQDEVGDGDLAVVQEAVDRCPKQAISLTET
jgi:ferredoxin